MSSSGTKLEPEAEPSPYRYAEAPSASSAETNAEQAAEERIQRLENAAFERGRTAAAQEMRSSMEAVVAQSRQEISHALQGFARERAGYYRRVEKEVVELALAIARKILHRESQLDPNALAGIARVTLEKMDAGTRVDLFVNSKESADWRHYFATRNEAGPMPEIHEDPALRIGECRIETSLGTTDIGMETQLKEIETGLLDLLAERPNAGAPNEETASSANAKAVATGAPG